jgi:O-methyltransferase
MAARLMKGDARADAIRASLAGARKPRALGPGPETEALRRAYLDLLKLCLCDLAGTTTVSVGPMPDGGVVAREMRGEQLRARSVGLDWPLQGITMSGLRRLDDLQSCVDSVVRDRVEGDFIEAGAWRGGATILMRAALDSSDDNGARTVWVADSFRGFPGTHDAEDGDVGAYLSAFDFLAVSEQEVRDNFARFGLERGVRFLPGYFKDTLPDVADRRWALVRLDGDSYEATHVALESLYPGLAVGGYLIVDDYGAVEECRRAVDQFRRKHGIGEALEAVDWTCVRWRRGSEARSGKLELESSEGPGGAAGRLPVAGSGTLSVPTVREVELGREVALLREGLADAQAEIQRMHEAARQLRHGYEQSLSWRLTRPLRAGVAMLRSRQSRS